MKTKQLMTVFFSLLLAACQSAGPAALPGTLQPTLAPVPTTAAPPPTQAAPPAQAPLLTGSAAPAGVIASQIDEIAGIWTIKHPHWTPAYMIIRPDGKYTFAKSTDGKGGESGTLWFEDQVFLIKDDFCPTPGKYKAELSAQDGQPSNLVFTPVEDGCTARQKILTSQPAAWFGPLGTP